MQDLFWAFMTIRFSSKNNVVWYEILAGVIFGRFTFFCFFPRLADLVDSLFLPKLVDYNLVDRS